MTALEAYVGKEGGGSNAAKTLYCVTWFHVEVLSDIASRLDVGAARTLEGNLENGACDARDGNAEDKELVLAAAASCGSAVILSSRHPWRHQSVRGSVRGGESEAIGGAAAVAAAGSAAQWRADRLGERRGERRGENIRLVSRIAKRARHYFYFRKKRFRRRSGVFVPVPEQFLPPAGPVDR